MADWHLYTGRREQHDGITRLPDPPPWRTFTGAPPVDVPTGGSVNLHNAQTYHPTKDAVRQVNAALYLRRPLLVTGAPGTGKSTLAEAVAYELKLGPVLHWPITSRTTLQDGLYQYDPLTRLYAANKFKDDVTPTSAEIDDIGNYIRLGPLGTALLPYERPRVLLIDEIDKSDIDLPNDLLTIFERGSYEIMELARHRVRTAQVMTADSTTDRVEVEAGTVTCRAFPLVIMTSNGEREFPPAFLRRCVSVELKQPNTGAELAAIVREHLTDLVDQDGNLADKAERIVNHFFARRSKGMLANDQLLNAIYLCQQALLDDRPGDVLELADQVMPYLNAPGDIDDD